MTGILYEVTYRHRDFADAENVTGGKWYRFLFNCTEIVQETETSTATVYHGTLNHTKAAIVVVTDEEGSVTARLVFEDERYDRNLPGFHINAIEAGMPYEVSYADETDRAYFLFKCTEISIPEESADETLYYGLMISNNTNICIAVSTDEEGLATARLSFKDDEDYYDLPEFDMEAVSTESNEYKLAVRQGKQDRDNKMEQRKREAQIARDRLSGHVTPPQGGAPAEAPGQSPSVINLPHLPWSLKM